MEPIILASSSPRRQEILKSLGLPFTVMSPHIEECLDARLSPEENAQAIANKKVEYVLSLITDRFLPWILGADTLIYHGGRVIGKAESREEARDILCSFSGQEHIVTTGIALYSGRSKHITCLSQSTKVQFKPLSDTEIEWYLDSGEWQGVAGAYRIQGKAAYFIKSISGQYHSVVGLPISDLYGILRESGYAF